MPPYIIARQIALKWLKDRPETPLPTTMDHLSSTTSVDVSDIDKLIKFAHGRESNCLRSQFLFVLNRPSELFHARI